MVLRHFWGPQLIRCPRLVYVTKRIWISWLTTRISSQQPQGKLFPESLSNTLYVQNVVPGQIIRDPDMDADEEQAEADRKRLDDDGNEGVDVDPDAAAYIRSR